MLLTGCSVGPSEQEIKAALQAEIDAVDQLAVSMLGEQKAEKLQIEIVSVSKWGCRAAKEQSYICDLEVDLNSAKGGRFTQKSSVKMAKDESGWMVIKDL
jgi:hypothetical protein